MSTFELIIKSDATKEESNHLGYIKDEHEGWHISLVTQLQRYKVTKV